MAYRTRIYYTDAQKADIWEGGHRVPFIVRWPGTVQPGSVCDETIGLTDLLATCATLLDTQLPDNAGEDSFSILPTLLGKQAEQPARPATVTVSSRGVSSRSWGRSTNSNSNGRCWDGSGAGIRRAAARSESVHASRSCGARRKIRTRCSSNVRTWEQS